MDEAPTVSATLDDLARAGGQRMIAAALQDKLPRRLQPRAKHRRYAL